MNSHTLSPGSWSTASFGSNSDTLTIEMSSLSEHLGLCKNPRGRLFALHCAAESMRGFVLARFVTSLLLMGLLFGLALMVV